MAWSPLGGGNLFAMAEEDERATRIIAVAEILGEKYGVAPDQILLSWLLQHPSGIIPVLGTSKAERIKKAMEATKVIMDRQEWFMLWRASTGHEVA